MDCDLSTVFVFSFHFADGRTFVDAFLAALDGAESAQSVKALVSGEAFDSVSLKVDLALCDDGGDGNLRRAARGSAAVMARLERCLRIERVSAKSFSTGTLFWYWPFYDTDEAESIKTSGFYSRMQFGEHSVKETFVAAHFSSLKEEILGSKHVGAKEFAEDIVGKGDEFAQTKTCKAMRSCTYYGIYYGRQANDAYRYGIADGSPLRRHHLHAVIAYTDFSDFSAAFSETFRKMSSRESFASVRGRNSKFHFCSRYLREAITYYGCIGADWDKYARNGREYGPFFTGMSVVLALPQFKIGLQGLSVCVSVFC